METDNKRKGVKGQREGDGHWSLERHCSAIGIVKERNRFGGVETTTGKER